METASDGQQLDLMNSLLIVAQKWSLVRRLKWPRD